MKLETRIVSLLLCFALMLTAACKKTPVPVDETLPVEVGFTASSQAVWVKGTTNLKTTFPYTNFGVWGIARHERVESPYVLWPVINNQLSAVNAPEGTQTGKEESNVVFTPASPAYWLGGYEYSFLAIAPNSDPGFALGSVTQASDPNSPDSMTFTYNMSSKYGNQNTYTFDLLGGASTTNGPVAAGRTAPQNLTFWHLLSQLSFEFKFGNDSNGQIAGTIKRVNLSVKPEATFTILYDDESTQSTAPLFVDANPTQTTAFPISFTANADTFTAGPICVVPQSPRDLSLTVDFEIAESDQLSVDYSLNIDLSAAQTPVKYLSNSRYNYKITIGSNAAITFDVSVKDWGDPIESEVEM
jgi:hypothetical protein